MNERTKKALIIGAIAVFVLAGALIALIVTEPKDDESSPNTTSTEEVTTKLLYEKSPDSISAIKVENSDGDFTITHKEGGEFGVEGYENVSLYSGYAEYLAEKVSSVTAQKTITESADDLGKFGLKNPAAKVTVKFGNGDTKVLCFGDTVPMSNDQNVYFCFGGEKTVYSILSTTASSFTTIQKVQLISTAVTDNPTDEDGKLPVVKELNIDRKDLPYDICIGYNEATGKHDLTAPVDLNLTETARVIIPNGLFGVSAITAVRYPITESDLETAGLVEPNGVLSMKTDKENITIIVGKKMTADDGTESYLCMTEGGQIIYQISADALPWMTIDVPDIAVSFVYRAVADNISDISITGNGVNEKFSKTGSFTDGDVIAKHNGKDMDSEDFLSLFKFLYAFRFESIENDATVTEGLTPKISVTVNCYDGSTETLDFYDLGNKRSAVAYNGKVSFIARTSYVERLISNLELLENGEDLVMTW